ncbi:hypothetical protein [Streptomyces sp. NPDC050504]|uniref:hypothetical protein n=1 Tax=Streptomyces sp. NPDC050504 TaxID=3365618 RepID=UPI0037AB8754
MTESPCCVRCGGLRDVRVVAYVDSASGPPRAVHACEAHRAVLDPRGEETPD